MAPPPLEIVFTTAGLNRVLNALNRIGAGFAKLNDPLNLKSAQQVGRWLNTSARNLERAGKVLKQAARDLNKAAQALNKAGLPNVNKPQNNPKQKGLWQRVNKLIGSTRVGFSNGSFQALPLIHDIINLLPSEVLGIPVRQIATTIVGVTAALYTLANAAAEAAKAMQSLAIRGGGSVSEGGRLAAIGAASGMSPSAAGDAAAAFHNRITSDDYARAFAAMNGIYAGAPGPFGEQDYTKQLLEAINNLSKISNPTERLRTARALGIEEFLPYSYLSRRTRQRIEGSDAQTKSAIFDESFMSKSAEFFASLGRVGDAIKNVISALGKPLLDDFTEMLNQTADILNRFAIWLNSHQFEIRATFDLFNGMLSGMQGDYSSALENFRRVLSGEGIDNLKNAMQMNTDATHANTQAINDLRRMYGRGERTDVAMPEGVSGEYLRRALEQGGFRLSPF